MTSVTRLREQCQFLYANIHKRDAEIAALRSRAEKAEALIADLVNVEMFNRIKNDAARLRKAIEEALACDSLKASDVKGHLRAAMEGK